MMTIVLLTCTFTRGEFTTFPDSSSPSIAFTRGSHNVWPIHNFYDIITTIIPIEQLRFRIGHAYAWDCVDHLLQ